MMATMQDFGGLLFGQGGSGLEEYLTPQQMQGIQNQSMLQAASALLQAGGPSARPVSLGQALGGALQAGQQGYSTAQQGAIQTLMARQKLDEAKRLGLYRQALAGANLGGVPPEGSAPVAAAPAPVADAPQARAPRPIELDLEESATKLNFKQQAILTEQMRIARKQHMQRIEERYRSY